MKFTHGKASKATLITLASIAIFIVLAILFLPTGFSNDVSKIGKGSKVVVLAYNNGTTNSKDMMDLLEKIRGSYTDKIQFLAVSVGAPIGKKFLRDYSVRQSTLVLFRGDGSVAKTMLASKDNEAILQQVLDDFVLTNN
ncbi:hypothetical protein MNBD_GAMMA22-2006 [hydrothermal vent metagenome]|uniref:DUF4174 domain-containing protein n=1 Tax=hydrothermal vent metagenome TaxID=652676 RepID=A0A3B1ATN9_9ZZZZ